jgi:hypothetical protein
MNLYVQNVLYYKYEMEAFMRFLALIILSYFGVTYFGDWILDKLMFVFGIGVTLFGYYILFLMFRGSLRWIGKQLNYGK